MIPYGKQSINDQDVAAVVEVLKSDFITQGPLLNRFETELAEYCGATHAVAVNSATSGLHIACLALGVGVGDVVWTTPITFVASANCALFCGAQVDFVDIDPLTINMSAAALLKKLQQAEKDRNLPKVVIPVHMTGQSCEMERIFELSEKYGFKIIEDASHAIGGKYQDNSIGSCRYSDITVFSFHPVKIITTGEGGACLTNNSVLSKKMQLYRSHGITRDVSLMNNESDGPWYYQQVELGFNYRMTDLQAALGVSQLTRLDEFVAKRHELVALYNECLKGLPLTLPYQISGSYSAYHLYVVRLHLNKLSKSHRSVFEELRGRGIGVNLHYIPVHTQPYYQNMGFRVGDYPEAESYYAEAISLPLFPDMTKDQQLEVIEALRFILC